MASIDKLPVEQRETLWSDRKRVLGMPLSFTRFFTDGERLYVKKGLLKTEMDEILLYRILDIKTTRTLGQKLCGVGTLRLYSADQTDRVLELKNIKNPEKLHRYLSDLIEKTRREKGIAGREIVGTASHGGPGGPGPHPDDLDEPHGPGCFCGSDS